MSRLVFVFCLFFQISSFDSFGDMRLTIIRSLRKYLKILLLGLTCSLRQWVAFFYAYSNGIFGNFQRRLLKICIQIKSISQMKRDSVASLVHNNLFRSLVTTIDCVFLCWIQWFFWKFSTTIIKDLCTNKVNVPIQKRFTRFARS